MKPTSVYCVLVGNIGTVYEGPSLRQALKDFAEYRRQSKTNYGRAAGEPVTLTQDGEIRKSYEPRRSLEDTIDDLSEQTISAMKSSNGCEFMSDTEFRVHWKELLKVKDAVPLTCVPEDYRCPGCDSGSQLIGSLSPVVDGSQFVRWGSFQATGKFVEGADPAAQPVRLFCDDCCTCWPITAELAEQLRAKVSEV
jgi:hypothetical protein